MAHDLDIAIPVIVEHRHDHPLQFVVERGGIAQATAFVFALTFFVTDRPPRDTLNEPFHPPTIDNAQARDAIQGGFHPARPRCFRRRLSSEASEMSCITATKCEALPVFVPDRGDGFTVVSPPVLTAPADIGMASYELGLISLDVPPAAGT